MEAFYDGLAEILEVDIREIGPDFNVRIRDRGSLAIISTLALIDECSDQVANGQKRAECTRVRDIEALIEGVGV